MSSREFTPDEARATFLEHVRHLAHYWANLPGKTALERTEGIAHSILATIDGSGCLPAMDLVLRPHPDDKKFHVDQEENYYRDGMVINDSYMSYEFFNPPGEPR